MDKAKEKTPAEIFKKVLQELGFDGYKPSEMSNSDYWLCTCTAMEQYAQQQPHDNYHPRMRKNAQWF